MKGKYKKFISILPTGNGFNGYMTIEEKDSLTFLGAYMEEHKGWTFDIKIKKEIIDSWLEAVANKNQDMVRYYSLIAANDLQILIYQHHDRSVFEHIRDIVYMSIRDNDCWCE